MVEKEKLLQDIMMLDFAVADITLFLDTHPSDEEAYEYYREACSRLNVATTEYTEKYGALNNRTLSKDNYNYIYGPWPWEVTK